LAGGCNLKNKACKKAEGVLTPPAFYAVLCFYKTTLPVRFAQNGNLKCSLIQKLAGNEQ
jgi:hypothetical protein